MREFHVITYLIVIQYYFLHMLEARQTFYAPENKRNNIGINSFSIDNYKLKVKNVDKRLMRKIYSL